MGIESITLSAHNALAVPNFGDLQDEESELHKK
jgi:hypothetical protein